MRKSIFTLVLVTVAAALLLTACGGQSSGPAPTPLPAAPAPYAGKTNALKGNSDAAAKGKDLFTQNCVSCHGADAKGDGPASAALTPKPANLVVVVPVASDDYLLWRISEGGAFAPFNSSMPAQKNNLSETEIWQVVTYLQTLK